MSSRVDLIYALHTGQTPLFLTHKVFSANAREKAISFKNSDEISARENAIPRSYIGLPALPSDFPDSRSSFPRVLDPILDADDAVAAVFYDLQYFCSEVSRQRRLQDPDFKAAICSIQYRLLQLQNTRNDIVSEGLRLTMLAFMTTTFQIPQSAGQQYPNLARRLHNSCHELLSQDQKLDVWNDFMMWSLLIGAMSLYGVQEDWLCAEWKRIVPADMTWAAALSRFKTLLWIDEVHSTTGQEAFEALQTGKNLKRGRASAWWVSGWGVCPLEM
jgi:hypothetical protein